MKINRRIKGMDISTLLEEELCGAGYFDGGEKHDLLDILQKYGVNSVRIRLWNDPYGETAAVKSGHNEVYEPIGSNGRYKYGAGTNDIQTALELARRASDHEMSVLLDFHYSDFWADPGKQYPPKAWKDYDENELPKAVYLYTKEVIGKFIEAGIVPYMVQIGNELTNGCCWPLGRRDYGDPGPGCSQKDTPYFNPILGRIINSGIRAVREISPETLIMLHLDNGGNNALYRSWFDGYFGLRDSMDFDVIGLSYYPFWHGNLEALENNMRDIAARYNKELVIAEVSMGHSMEDYRSYERLQSLPEIEPLKGMATREELVKNLDYPMTPEGQCEFMKHLNRIISDIDGDLGRGYYYWEPAWIPVPGCGWATPASLEYIHDKGPCGNEWANQALFDYKGNALPALGV